MGNTRQERRIRVPARTGAAIEVHAGDTLRVIDVAGEQICDFFAFNAADIDETLSATHTRTQNLGLRLGIGAVLYSNLRRPMFELIADTVGVHDLLVAPCDRQRDKEHSTGNGIRSSDYERGYANGARRRLTDST